MLKDQVFTTIKNRDLILREDKVLVALSGGPDSLALIHMLNSLKRQLNIEVFAAHLNHMIRGRSADADEKFVRSFCKNLNIPVHIERFDVPSLAKKEKVSLEDAGRRARYKMLGEAALEFGANKIALGHNSNDNVETVIMRLIGGAGARGLLGIRAKRGNIIRPLIDSSRAEIEAYCRTNRLKPRIDRSNFDLDFLRNKIRHKVLPLFRSINPRVDKAILQAVEVLRGEHQYISDISAKGFHAATINKRAGSISLDIDKLLMYPDPIRRQVVRIAIFEVKGDLDNVSYGHIEEILGKLSENESWRLDLPRKIFVLSNGDELQITDQLPLSRESVSFSYKFNVPGTIHISELGSKIKAEIVNDPSRLKLKTKDKNEALLDYSKTGKALIIRSRREGDRFSPLGISGKKKLKDFLINEKVPQKEKQFIPIIEARGKIAWVGGLRIDNAFKVNEKTRAILRLKMI